MIIKKEERKLFHGRNDRMQTRNGGSCEGERRLLRKKGEVDGTKESKRREVGWRWGGAHGPERNAKRDFARQH